MWDRLEDFDEYTTTLSTCNEMNPAQNDPGNFQVNFCVDEEGFSSKLFFSTCAILRIFRLFPNETFQ